MQEQDNIPTGDCGAGVLLDGSAGAGQQDPVGGRRLLAGVVATSTIDDDNLPRAESPCAFNQPGNVPAFVERRDDDGNIHGTWTVQVGAVGGRVHSSRPCRLAVRQALTQVVSTRPLSERAHVPNAAGRASA